MTLRIAPVSKDAARRFVQDHHRHNEAPTKAQVTLCVGLYDDEKLVGVATAGNPVARHNADGVTLEVNRTCIEGFVQNGNSMLYGAVCRAAKALGYERVITYTLHEESGASLKASGFTLDADVGARSWEKSNTNRVRTDVNLFGERRQAQNVPKYRWVRSFA